MHALIDQLSTVSAQLGVPLREDCSFLGVGHSLGGATISGVMADEDRIHGGINLDGAFWVQYRRDLTRPFLLMGEPQHNSTNDSSWAAWEKAQTHWWSELSVQDSLHLDYCDAAMVVKLLGISPSPEQTLGPIDGSRMRTITTSFVEAFFDMILGNGDGMLEGELPSQQWPEVVHVANNTDV
jgi:hypothetical protein